MKRALARARFTLTTENTVQVAHTTVAAIQDALYALWCLTMNNTIAGFTIEGEHIQGYRAH